LQSWELPSDCRKRETETQMQTACVVPDTRPQTPNHPIPMSEDHTSECNDSPCCKPGRFSWNELVTTDVEGASTFYTGLFGWTTVPFSAEYTLFNKEDQGVGGMMKARQPGTPAQWMAYVNVEDVDASVTKAVNLGGEVVVPAMDIPEIGRIAVVIDPQQASIGLFKPLAKG
jgi:uncharacterized protein